MILMVKKRKIILKKYKKELQKTNQRELRTETVIKIKGDKLHVKRKGHNNSFNSWNDKKDSINEWIFSRTKILNGKYKC